MSYYFDYLTLLLAGAFDALARIAVRACNSCTIDEWSVNFRIRRRYKGVYQKGKNTFINELATRDSGLHSLVSSERFQDFLILLYELRNTIHGKMAEMGTNSAAGATDSYISIEPQQDKELVRAATNYSSIKDWGLREKTYNLVIDHSTLRTERRTDLQLEPYTYASMLFRESLKWINEIAGATNISGLLPSGQTVSQLPNGPPADDEYFSSFSIQVDS
jgi:hypothetical protein